MGGLSIWHWLVVGVIILLLFGKGRFSDMMGDVAKGLKSFKKGMTEDEEVAASARAEEQRRLRDDRVAAPVQRAADPEPLREAQELRDPELDRREP
jgi:sec-independent protein translocase protein TatA